MKPLNFVYDSHTYGGRTHETVDPALIRAYAEKSGFRYPEAYVDIVSKHGAKIPAWRATFVFESARKGEFDSDIVVFLCHFIPSFQGDIRYVPMQHEDLAEWLEEPRLVPFFDTDTSRWVCFDYRHSATDPTIVLVAPNAGGPDSLDSIVQFVAHTFEEFMDMLTSQEEAEAMLERLNGE